MINVGLIAYFYGISLLTAIPFLIHVKYCNAYYCLLHAEYIYDR